MRIKRGQHAGDGGFDQVAVFDLVDIAFAHALENVTEKPKLPVGILLGGGLRRCQGRNEHARREQGGAEQCHMPQADAVELRPFIHLTPLLQGWKANRANVMVNSAFATPGAPLGPAQTGTGL